MFEQQLQLISIHEMTAEQGSSYGGKYYPHPLGTVELLAAFHTYLHMMGVAKNLENISPWHGCKQWLAFIHTNEVVCRNLPCESLDNFHTHKATKNGHFGHQSTAALLVKKQAFIFWEISSFRVLKSLHSVHFFVELARQKGPNLMVFFLS